MKTKNLTFGLLAALLGGTLLTGCGPSEGSATINNMLADSIYGTVDFDGGVDLAKLKTGDKVGFTITPDEDYFIGNVTVNGTVLTADGAGEGENSGHYTVELKEGVNRLTATFDVDPTVDIVRKFKLNVDDRTYYDLVNRTSSMDFRADGVEQMKTVYLDEDAFINYVDGDTTHMETLHYGYTVKIRYLSIDTPESTSELEEWGKTASLFNQAKLSSAKHVILQSQGRAMYPTLGEGQTESVWESTVDSNGRNLAYVWYTDEADPKLSDFRCLNLEMVYNGFSFGTGSIADCGVEYYKVFEKARRSAEANKRGMFSGVPDENYWYDDPVEKTLEEIYAGTTKGGTDSEFNDEYTLYSVEGYVTRKVEGAFYFQDKPDYEQVGTEPVEAYGMYVFTYTQTAIQPGQHVRVIGVLSEYGGTLQMMGISWKDINPNPKRDTMILDDGEIYDIVPVKVAASDWTAAEYSYNHVLVEFVDDIYAQNEKSSTLGGSAKNDYAEGGTHTLNKYNETYPFYNTSNKIIFRGKVGSDSGAQMRLTMAQEILLVYGTEISYSYKFFTGGETYYNPGNPESVAYAAGYYDYGSGANVFEAFKDEWEAVKDTLTPEVYTRKQFHLVGISQFYTSTSGKTEAWTVNIVSAGDVTFTGTLPAQN